MAALERFERELGLKAEWEGDEWQFGKYTEELG
jgi:hypothetical protein